MFDYVGIAILIACVVVVIVQFRRARKHMTHLPGDLTHVEVDGSGGEVLSLLDASGPSTHDTSSHADCHSGAHDAGGFDCGSDAGFDGGGHH